MLKRRNFLKMTSASLLVSGQWPGALRAQEKGQGESGWSFLAVNDLHYRNADCGPWFEKLVAAMKASAPAADFCLLGGDQADDAKAEQLAGVRDAFATMGKKIYVTPGNHDRTADGARKLYDEIFPNAVNVAIEHRGWQLLTLDSTHGALYKETSIQEPTLAFLDETLPRLSKTKPTLIQTHFPLGEGVTYRPANADALLERFREYNLQGVLSGHWHGYTEREWKGGLLTTNRCCSRVRGNHDKTTQKGWFICHVEEGKIRREFVEIPAELRG